MMEAGAKIGTSLDLGEKLGEGAMGEVFLGTFVRGKGKKMSAAIKRVPASKMDIKEVALQSELSKLPECNIHIACIYQLKKVGNNFYIVMEYIKGDDMYGILEKLKQPLGLRQLKRLFKQALEGLQFIHSKSIAHGDIKMENFMLDKRTDQLKYIDFGYGCSKETCKSSPVLHGTGYLDPPEAFSHEKIWSKTLQIPHYLERYVPEPDEAKTLDHIQRADIWALGSFFVELTLAEPGRIYRTKDVGMSGEQLKSARSASWLASTHLKKRNLLRETHAYDRLYAIIDGMMKIDPDDRISPSAALKVLTAKK